MDELYAIPLFEGLSAEEFNWIRENTREFTVEQGEYVFRQGEPMPGFFIVLEGEMLVTRFMMGHERVLGTTPRGVIAGEIPLLDGTLISTADARAIAPTRLLMFDIPSFRRIFAFAPTLGARIIATATERMANIANMGRQQEKITALGKLASGLAHELNNPAAAARRAVASLRSSLYDLQLQALALLAIGLTPAQISELIAAQRDAIRTSAGFHLSALELSDCESAIAEWLEARGIAHGWEMAFAFANAGMTASDLDALISKMLVSDPAPLLIWMCSMFGAAGLIQELEQGTRRISDLVEKVKGYTYMDEAPVQDVDIHAALENTLSVLGQRLGSRRIIREFDPNLPRVAARGTELNLIWTNLIENAAEATDNTGTIRLITRFENTFAMIEINDDGVGISPEIEQRIWEPFFTTKDPASHTGLGLDIVHRVVRGHSGTIEVRPEPGRTRFIIRLPIQMIDE
jgi:signal transduction histidine kinase